MNSFFKIHFMNFFFHGYKNAGDNFCSPLMFFIDYFKNYNIVYHTISAPSYYEISKNDVVIIGGGGILYDNWNNNINRILDCCDNVILWGAGTNSSDKEAYSSTTGNINYDKFKLIGVRDFINNAGLPYAPCVSCMLPHFAEIRKIKPSARIGTMLSFGYKPSDKFENLDHFTNINAVFDFIAKHEIIITSSYHCAYWGTLCNRKVIAVSNGSIPKISNQKFSPLIITENDFNNEEELEKAISLAPTYPGALDNCVNMTYQFFLEVKNIIENMYPSKLNGYTDYYTLKSIASFGARLYDINNKLTAIEKKLQS